MRSVGQTHVSAQNAAYGPAATNLLLTRSLLQRSQSGYINAVLVTR